MNPEMEPVRRSDEPRLSREKRIPLVPEPEVGAIKDRWDVIKASFVDDPRAAVRQADRLVGDVVEVLNQAVARARSKLGRGLDEGALEAPNTEELRRALQSYQGLIERFLGQP